MKLFKDDGKDIIDGDSPIEFSLEQALEEIDIHPTWKICEGNFIGFVNDRDETIQFQRHQENEWTIDVPIIEAGKYTHSLQVEDLSTESVKQIVRRFFQEGDWESLVNFKRNSNGGLEEIKDAPEQNQKHTEISKQAKKGLFSPWCPECQKYKGKQAECPHCGNVED